MSLNTIQLTPRLTADLYSDTLIQLTTNGAPDYKIKYLGNKDSNILILVNDENFSFKDESKMSFLNNVLVACKLSLDDVCLVNLYSFASEYYQQLKKWNIKIVLLFDVEPIHLGLPVNISTFQVQKFNSTMYMHAPSLEEIEKEKELKQQLWSSLKQIFDV